MDWTSFLSVPGAVTGGPEAGAPGWGVPGGCHGISLATGPAAPHNSGTGAAGKAISRNVFGESAATLGQLR